MAILWGDVVKLHLHQHVHLQEGDGALGVTVGLLQDYCTVLGADIAQLGLNECNLLCKLEFKGRGVEGTYRSTVRGLTWTQLVTHPHINRSGQQTPESGKY